VKRLVSSQVLAIVSKFGKELSPFLNNLQGVAERLQTGLRKAIMGKIASLGKLV